jgi:predicted nucleotide-binding protein (sugar kinase/HSP70/actin superfamily)
MTTQWKHYENPPWKREDKDDVTVLLNVVERRKSALVSAFMRRIGIKHIDLGTATTEDAAVGKMYGTPGLCNPVYFTSGQIIRTLDAIRAKTAMTKEEVCEKYVFVCPSGPCSPCRYGMYTQEYFKAINGAGYRGFRIITFSADIFDMENEPDDALQFDFEFRVNLLICLILADAVHAREVETLPYEKHAGATRKVTERAERMLAAAVESRLYLVKIPWALRKIAAMYDAIEVTSRRAPKIYITGEIFANNAHGDPNYGIREFCIREGCEPNPALFSARVFYEFYRRLDQTWRELRYGNCDSDRRRLLVRFLVRQRLGLVLTQAFVTSYFGAIRSRTEYPDTAQLFAIGDPFYNWRVMGGEGNLEVAEAIHQHDRCDGFISIKPFGCMPSSGISDGVQAKVQEVYPDLNFISIETSGDNATNVLNRVSMVLFKAKKKARARDAARLGNGGEHAAA